MNEPEKPPQRRWIHWLVTAMVFVALYAWMTRGNASPLMGQPAPDLSMTVAAGAEPGGPRKVTLAELRGEVVVLDFWASWCGACKRTTPVAQRPPRGVRRQGSHLLCGERRAHRPTNPAGGACRVRHQVPELARPDRHGSKTIRHQDAPHGHRCGPRWAGSLGFHRGSQQNSASWSDFRSPELAEFGHG